MLYKEIIKKLAIFLLKLAGNMLFKAIDTDNDGKLSRKELKEFVLTLHSIVEEKKNKKEKK